MIGVSDIDQFAMKRSFFRFKFFKFQLNEFFFSENQR